MSTFNKTLRGSRSISNNALAPRSGRSGTRQSDAYWSGLSASVAEQIQITYGLQGAGGGTQACPGDTYFSSGAAAGIWRTGTQTLKTSGVSLPVVIGGGGTSAGAGTATTLDSISASGGNGANRNVCGASNADFSGDCSRLGGDFVCGGTGTRLDAGQGYGGGAGSHANACTNGSGGLGQFEQFTGNGTGIGGGGVVGPAAGAAMNAAVQYGGGQGTYGGNTQTAPANRGGGASGGGAIGSCNQGNGGSGVAYLRYRTQDAEGLIITGGTKSTNGVFTVHTFTANGSFTIARA
jgi:hypothetical protein